MIDINLNIEAAAGDYLIDASGKKFFDLCMGYGSVSLGHNYEPIVAMQKAQMETYTSPGFINASIHTKAINAVEAYVSNYNVHGFYPSGANAIEIAIKMAMVNNKRSKVMSFANSMHGKTLFANKLGFDSFLNDDNQIVKIPFVGELNEAAILEKCQKHMKTGEISAIIIEPIQMSGGGFQASDSFYTALQSLAHQFGVVQIYDEILIGFHRIGHSFFFKKHKIQPDIIVAGKAMGSGFPTAVILQKEDFDPPNTFRGGGTFFNHPMTCASIVATLQAYETLQIETHIQKIEACILNNLPTASLSGAGALWNINLGTQENTLAAVRGLLEHQIVLSFYSHYIRFFPNFQVDLSKLKEACQIVQQYV